MLMAWISDWPLLRQIRRRADGTGPESMSGRTLGLRARLDGAETARSVCPYCGVGCGQLVHHRDGEIVAVEGDPESPVNQGTLCPKGAASHELLTNPGRLRKVRYRAPRSTRWQELDLDEAMDMLADRVWESRRRTFVRTTADLPEDDPSRTGPDEEPEPVNHTAGICHLGGATLDNEENYLIKKLFTAGLGMVPVSNQARI
jgi:formate dehydrogenase major subunit